MKIRVRVGEGGSSSLFSLQVSSTYYLTVTNLSIGNAIQHPNPHVLGDVERV